ncbi:barstar family protein [Marivivens marinus]|uniref:barstar family protein n=1 Tax=Marivivens marinus TaxID=3110173 RepID=UPI003B846166
MGTTAIHNRADWPFIQDGAVTLFLKQQVLDAAIEAVRDEGYSVHRIDCGREDTMMRDLSHALRWEKQFGYEPDSLNLDALNDALCGEPCDERPKLLLVLDRFAGFRKRGADTATAMLDIIEYQSRNHLLFGNRLLAFVRTNNPNTHIEGLGGRAAQWNKKEWLMKSRGV